MTIDSSLGRATVPRSLEVREEALARAERLANGLFPHQVEGVAFLLARRRGILADDMGLGKTRQSIIAMAESAPQGPWLVVCPASVKQNWALEIAAVRPHDDIRIVGPGAPPPLGFASWVVINYDILKAHMDSLVEMPWAGFIFDEAHYLKNHRTQRSRFARLLTEESPDAVMHVLTGTPLTNRPRDLFPLLALVRHSMGKSFLSFARRYCNAYHNGYGWVTDGASNLDELRVQLHGVMLRRTKNEVLNLPPKFRRWLPVDVDEGLGRREMRRVLELLLAGALERRQVADDVLGSELSTGRRNARHQDYIRVITALTSARLALAKAKVKTTIEFLDGVVEQGEKVIVFSAFDEPVQRIARHFGDAAVVLTGKTPSRSRQKLVDRFQTDPNVRVFVANIVAGAVGINLTAARQVVFNDLDWVPANHFQAEDRAYRIGQAGTVNVTYMVAPGTVDDFVRTSLEAKAALIDAVVEGNGDIPLGSGLLEELQDALRSLSPEIATLSDDESGEDPVDRVLREVTAAVERKEAAERAAAAGGSTANSKLPSLSAEAIRALARALAGPRSERFRVTGSRGARYELDVVDGGDVLCSCAGFHYRGACRHARDLKAALVAGGELPEGVDRLTE